MNLARQRNFAILVVIHFRVKLASNGVQQGIARASVGGKNLAGVEVAGQVSEVGMELYM